MNRLTLLGVLCVVFTASCNSDENKSSASADIQNYTTPIINYSVVKSFPHDTTSFTEGLLIHNGRMFESTGHTDSYTSSRSLFGTVDTVTGQIAIKAEIDKRKYFGEGIVFLNDKIYQLTDTTHIGFVYDAKTYKKLGEFHYTGDGWGLTTNGVQIIMSNGSNNIVYRDTASFAIVKTLAVTDSNGPVSRINELELINGFIYANHFLTNDIFKIDTATGRVVSKLDLSSLAQEAKTFYPGSEEMNGIAFDASSDRIYITGKLWPRIYEIKFSH